MFSLQQQISKIQERNKKVEVDKAWETSLTRKVIITLLTYAIIVTFFYAANLPNPWINAIVPSIAFLISTLVLPIFKNLWIKRIRKI